MLLTIHIIPIVHCVFCWCCLCFDLNLTIPSATAVIYSVVKYLYIWLWFCLLPSLPLSRPGHYHWGWDSGRWQQENYALWHWYDEVYLLWLLPGSLSCWCHCWGKNKCIKQGIRHSIHHQNPNEEQETSHCMSAVRHYILTLILILIIFSIPPSGSKLWVLHRDTRGAAVQ